MTHLNDENYEPRSVEHVMDVIRKENITVDEAITKVAGDSPTRAFVAECYKQASLLQTGDQAKRKND